MEKINTRILAIISFSIFLINILKYYFINILHLLYPYSSENRLFSYLMLPIIVLGLIFSIIAIFIGIKSIRKNLLNIILSIPLILFFIYFFF